MTVLRLMLLAGITGHAINMYCDRLLSIFPNGTLKLASVQKLQEEGYAAHLMEGVSPSAPMRAGVWGIFAIVLEFFGYAALAAYAFQQAKVVGSLMFVSTVVCCIVMSAYHLKCGLAEYLFLKYGRDEHAKALMLDLMNSAPVLKLGFLGLFVYLIVLIIAIVTGAIGFPLWAVVFTILPIFILMYPFQIIGTMHIAAMVSMLAWMLLI